MGNPQTRSKAESAQKRLKNLIQKLGGRCAMIDCAEPYKNLEIDHIDGRDWDLTKFSQMGRVRKYEKEAELGLLQVLCTSHNKRKQ